MCSFLRAGCSVIKVNGAQQEVETREMRDEHEHARVFKITHTVCIWIQFYFSRYYIFSPHAPREDTAAPPHTEKEFDVTLIINHALPPPSFS